jgi:hypothetical protein
VLRFCTSAALFGFSCTPLPHLTQVLLEVEMRFEQIIAAVTRPVVIATVREIEAARVFANASLHRWLQRMPLGMPAYSGSLPLSSFGDAGGINPADPGSKRGRSRCQPLLALANCPAGTVMA